MFSPNCSQRDPWKYTSPHLELPGACPYTWRGWTGMDGQIDITEGPRSWVEASQRAGWVTVPEGALALSFSCLISKSSVTSSLRPAWPPPRLLQDILYPAANCCPGNQTQATAGYPDLPTLPEAPSLRLPFLGSPFYTLLGNTES